MKRFYITLMIALSLPAICFAGAAKTAGPYELMSDDANQGGSVLPQSGALILYQSIGNKGGVATITAGTYELTGGFLGVVDETPPTIGFQSPAPLANVSGSTGFTATAFDENGVTAWTLSFGPTASPSTWKNVASGSSAFSSTQIGSLDTIPYSGTYTAALRAVDDRGNEATETVSFSIMNLLTINGTVPMRKWVLVSTPISPDPSSPISMYGQDEYKVYRWNPAKQAEQGSSKYEYPQSLGSGYGYWVKSYDRDLNYSYTGVLPDTTKDYSISATTGWNQIGAPFNRKFPWNQVRVKDGSSVYDLSMAADMGIISDTLIAYDHAASSWIQKDSNTAMDPETGYNVRVYKNVELLFSPDVVAPEQTARTLARVIRDPYDFRVNISAGAAGAADVENYFGASRSASAQFDRFDLEEPLKSMETGYVSLYFPHADWDALSGNYTNDMRPPLMRSSETGQWNMNVETNLSGQAVTLTWDSSLIPSETHTVFLVNLDNGDRIDMSTTGEYSYTAGPDAVSTTHFKIEIKLKSDTALEITKTYTLNPGWNLVSMPLEPEVTGALFQLADDLPLLDVFQYYDGKFYAGKEADIQAGVGYWIFVKENTEIDIQGLPAAPEARVPMKSGWNIIGNPYDSALPWDDSILVSFEGGLMKLSEAAAAGILSSDIFKFDAQGYIKQSAGSNLEPWKGYMVKFFKEAEIVMRSPER